MSLVHLNTEARPCATGPYTFRRRITIVSPGHPSNKRNSMTDRCLSLTPIVTFRFWWCRNGHRNPHCAVIVFGMRDLNIMTHEVFGNKLKRIPRRAMWSVKLLTGHLVSVSETIFSFIHLGVSDWPRETYRHILV
jgi:hypothetical protein